MVEVVDVTLRGSVYKVCCESGEVPRLSELAVKVGKMVDEIAGGDRKAKVSDTLLLLLVCLKLQDKVEELDKDLKSLGSELDDCKARCEAESKVRSSLEELVNYTAARVTKLVNYLPEKNDDIIS